VTQAALALGDLQHASMFTSVYVAVTRQHLPTTNIIIKVAAVQPCHSWQLQCTDVNCPGEFNRIIAWMLRCRADLDVSSFDDCAHIVPQLCCCKLAMLDTDNAFKPSAATTLDCCQSAMIPAPRLTALAHFSHGIIVFIKLANCIHISVGCYTPQGCCLKGVLHSASVPHGGSISLSMMW
jgi:hypothetical protein